MSVKPLTELQKPYAKLDRSKGEMKKSITELYFNRSLLVIDFSKSRNKQEYKKFKQPY